MQLDGEAAAVAFAVGVGPEGEPEDGLDGSWFATIEVDVASDTDELSSRRQLPAPGPPRTVHDSFPSHGSRRTKALRPGNAVE